MKISKGDKSTNVKRLQRHLNLILRTPIVIDGDFGRKTEYYVKQIQQTLGYSSDGVMSDTQLTQLELLVLNLFIAFIDAGHGGWKNKKYLTPKRYGKRMYHPNTILHDGGHFYEGVENRFVANLAINYIEEYGIRTLKIYDEEYDTPLGYRTRKVRKSIENGFFGHMHSCHSNAISISKNSKNKLEKTRGFLVFTDRVENISDIFAEFYFDIINEEFKEDWTIRKNYRGQSKDFEADFKILREVDLKSNQTMVGATLGEFGFFTSSIDAKFIIENRDRRAKCIAKFIKKVHDYMVFYDRV